MWTLTMLHMRGTALCAHNVYSAKPEDPPTVTISLVEERQIAKREVFFKTKINIV